METPEYQLAQRPFSTGEVSPQVWSVQQSELADCRAQLVATQDKRRQKQLRDRIARLERQVKQAEQRQRRVKNESGE